MIFNLERIDLFKVKSLYFLRGYENQDEDHYCTSMVLFGNEENEYEPCLFISKKTLGIKDGKELLRYLKNRGMKLTSANVLEADFDRFYNSRAFKKVCLED